MKGKKRGRRAVAAAIFASPPADLAERLRNFGWRPGSLEARPDHPTAGEDADAFCVVVPENPRLRLARPTTLAPGAPLEVSIACSKLDVPPNTPVSWTDPFPIDW
jgi:hypothetical protein